MGCKGVFRQRYGEFARKQHLSVTLTRESWSPNAAIEAECKAYVDGAPTVFPWYEMRGFPICAVCVEAGLGYKCVSSKP